MKRVKPIWEFVIGASFVGILTLLLFISLGRFVPPQQAMTSTWGDSYPPPAETLPVPTLLATATEASPEFFPTMTSPPTTPFPTLTLRPGPTPTLIPLIEVDKDAAGILSFVTKEKKDAKSVILKVELDAAGKKIREPVMVSDGEVQNDFQVIASPDGSYLAMLGPWSTLSIFNQEKEKFEKVNLMMGSGSKFFNWFPDSHHILIGGSSVLIADPFSGEYTHLVVAEYGSITGAAASPDGQFVVYAYSNDTYYQPGLWIINANGQNPRLLWKGISPSHITWSPDGKRIAFLGDGWQVINADGSDLHAIAPGINLPNCYFLPPLWSPDSRRLAIATSESGTPFCEDWSEGDFAGTRIVLVDLENGKAEPLLLDAGTGSFDPAWSPDGRQLAFVATRSGVSEVWVVNADGSDLRQITDNKVPVRFPKWRKTK